jgi:hypothetical protein
MIDHSRVRRCNRGSATHDAFRTWQGSTSMLPPLERWVDHSWSHVEVARLHWSRREALVVHSRSSFPDSTGTQPSVTAGSLSVAAYKRPVYADVDA